MLVSCVLRLAPEALTEGRLVGTVLLVETGVTTPFHSLDELLVLLVPRPRPDGGQAPDSGVISLPTPTRTQGNR